MPSVNIVRTTPIIKTPRVLQMEGIFELSPSERSEIQWEVNLPVEEKDWNIGLIVGPSGCGKTTVTRELFSDNIISGFEWSHNKSLVDDFPKGMGIKEITALLSSVGFSSPPSWLRPFHVLSNGEQFRVTMARALAESSDLTVVDEFTSVVDRTVAQIGSSAIAKTIRRRNQKFIAVACHYDIVEWLQPDWIYQPHLNEFKWRRHRHRPEINLTIRRVHRRAWDIFKQHHYLDTKLNVASHCYVAFVDDEPVAFTSVMSFPHPHRPGWREHRTVCLPDYQGVGIGNGMSEKIAAIYRATGKPYFSVTSNPAMTFHRAKSKNWKLKRVPGRINNKTHTSKIDIGTSQKRVTASFEYIGEPDFEMARGFELIK